MQGWNHVWQFLLEHPSELENKMIEELQLVRLKGMLAPDKRANGASELELDATSPADREHPDCGAGR